MSGGLLILQSRSQPGKPQKTANFSFFSFPEARLVSFPLDFQENKEQNQNQSTADKDVVSSNNFLPL